MPQCERWGTPNVLEKVYDLMRFIALSPLVGEGWGGG